MVDHYSIITPRFPPFEHQRRIVQGLIPTFREHGCAALFLDIGCGKTKTILDAAAILYAKGDIDSLLIIPPKSLIGSWQDQIETHAAFAYRVIAWDAQKANSAKWAKTFYSCLLIRPDEGVPVFIVNVEAFSKPNKKLMDCIDAFTMTHKTLGVVDESTTIKSSESHRGIAIGGGTYQRKKVEGINRKLKYRAIMTGTEFTTSPLDVYQQFEFLSPGYFGFQKFYFFKSHYAILVERLLAGGRTFKEVIGYQHLPDLQAKMAPVTFRARKEDCLDLPDTIDEVLPVDLSAEQVKHYRALKQTMMTVLDSGEVISIEQKMTLFGKFRQLVGGAIIVDGVPERMAENPKLDALLAELSDNSGQAIIWASFRHEITAICEAIEKEFGLGSAARYDGDTANPEGEKKRFLDGKARFFVANPRKGGQGLNLQYNTSVQYWYSFPVELEQWLQARGRTPRAGQVEKCVYRLLVSRFPGEGRARDTVDARILSILQSGEDILSRFQSGGIQDIEKLV
jgi:SNF2 family DNA or RNA helicase